MATIKRELIDIRFRSSSSSLGISLKRNEDGEIYVSNINENSEAKGIIKLNDQFVGYIINDNEYFRTIPYTKEEWNVLKATIK